MEDVQQRNRQKMNELDAMLIDLRARREGLRGQAEELADKRNRLNDEANQLRADVLKLREERDSMNREVQQLKVQRTEVKTQIGEKIAEAKTLRERIREGMAGRPAKDLKVLQKEFEDVEWNIQTSSLTLQEEKELVGKSRKLEIQIKVHEKLRKLYQKREELGAKVQNLRKQSEVVHQQLTEKAQKSQQIHSKMQEAIIKLDEIEEQADTLHKSFIKIKEEVKPIQDQMAQVINEIRQLREQVQEEERKKRKESEDKTRVRMGKLARDKMKRGEKLSWEEFQLLAESGMESQD